MSNQYGDVELGVAGMRALAHPVRLAILNELQRHGPATATGLSPHVGASPSVTSWHLRQLAKYGLVHDADTQGSGRERWWQAVRGFRVAAGTDDGPDGAAARRLLWQTLEQVEGDVVGAWSAEVEPHLEPHWRALADRSNTTVLVTADELAELQDRIEAVLAPYVLRKDADPDEVPAGARLVRLLRYALPDRGPGPAPDGNES